MRPEPKISKHYATPDEVPALFDAAGNRVFIEHRHIAQWFLDNDYPLSAATKYIFRAGKKQSVGMSLEEKAVEDLKKAQEYIGFKIEEYQSKIAKASQRPTTLNEVIRKQIADEGFSTGTTAQWEMDFAEEANRSYTNQG